MHDFSPEKGLKICYRAYCSLLEVKCWIMNIKLERLILDSASKSVQWVSLLCSGARSSTQTKLSSRLWSTEAYTP